MAREQYGWETNRRKKANCLLISTNCVLIMMVLEKKERERERKYLKKGNMKENVGYGFEKV
jgi:hypothetical protein